MKKIVLSLFLLLGVRQLYGTAFVLQDGIAATLYKSKPKAGMLDATFGPNANGLAITNVSSFSDNDNGADDIIAMIQQADGKIVVAGASTNALNHKHFTLARYTKDGVLDNSFGLNNNGVVITNASAFNNYSDGSDIINAMLQQSDGKIVVGGSSRNNGINNDGTNRNSDFTLARYTNDGVLDTTFGTGGVTITNASAFNGNPDRDDIIVDMIQQQNGKIVVAGYSNNVNTRRDFTLARYSKDGVLDTTFGEGGVTITNVSRDFNNNTTGNNTINAMLQQTDGKIVVAGYSTNDDGNQDFTLARYTKDGVLDTTFGANTNGVVILNASNLNVNAYGSDQIEAIIETADGKIVVAGYSTNIDGNLDFTLARYTKDGILDTTFGGNGNGLAILNASAFNNNNTGTDKINAIIQTADGKIVVAGISTNPTGLINWDFTLARYLSNGLLDTSFGTNGVTITNASAFNGNNTGVDEVRAILQQSDGKIVVAGMNAKIDDKYDFTLARYTTDIDPLTQAASLFIDGRGGLVS